MGDVLIPILAGLTPFSAPHPANRAKYSRDYVRSGITGHLPRSSGNHQTLPVEGRALLLCMESSTFGEIPRPVNPEVFGVLTSVILSTPPNPAASGSRIPIRQRTWTSKE